MMPKNLLTLYFAAAISFILWGICCESFALDGNRRGFIFGGGLGIGVTSQDIRVMAATFQDGRRATPLAFNTNLLVGHAPTNTFAIFLFNKAVWFKWTETVLPGEFGGLLIPQEVHRVLTNGLTGLGFKYFLRPSAPSLFLSGGVGLAWWAQPYEENTDCDLPRFPLIFPCPDRSGPGILAGGGYEFARHFMVAMNLIWGAPSWGSSQFANAHADGISVMIDVNYLGY